MSMITALIASVNPRRHSPAAQTQRKPLAVHLKVLTLGVSLLLSCLIIAVIGMLGVTSIQRFNTLVSRHDAPALAYLLQIDRDLYQAQLGLERATAATDLKVRKAGLAFFAENVAQSEQRFASYRKLALGGDIELAAINAYAKDRTTWLSSATELANVLDATLMNSEVRPSGNTGAKPTAGAPDSITRLAQVTGHNFEPMREHINVIVDNVYQPMISESGDLADHHAWTTFLKLLIGTSVAILGGAMLTANMARFSRIQQRETDLMNAEREAQNRRQTFEARLNRGLEMAQDETASLRLVEEAIVLAAPDVNAEVLLADSSRAHVHQAASTAKAGAGRCCNVTTPNDCPAVRRGHRLNFESSTHFDACPHLKGRPGGSVSAVCIPLNIMGQTAGVLHATSTDMRLPPDDQIRSLEQIASKASERLGLLRAFHQTEAQAACDPLTGLMNRRSLEEKVHQLGRQNISFAVAYGDLDHFKNLNDTYGHETGDKALRTFAQILKASVRPEDLPARWGGEEFVLVLPNATCEAAAAAIERVRTSLAKTLQTGAMPNFTVSFGVADISEGGLFVDVLASADAALLRAKREGRNRTILSSSAYPPVNASQPLIGREMDSNSSIVSAA